MTASNTSRMFAWAASLILCIVAISNVASSWRHFQNSVRVAPAAETQYSYIGNDYPDYYPMDPLSQVLMSTEESVHYPLSGSTAAAQWASNNPRGGGYVHLGEPKRYLCVSMFHQLHCLRYIRQAIITADDPYASIPHVQHCLNYLRQAILCQPDLTLEDLGWRDSNLNWQPGKTGATHTCRDWGQVYEEMERNLQQWEQWWNMSYPGEFSPDN